MPTDPIDTAAAAPKKATIDGNTVEQHPILERVEAERYVKSKTAATKKNLGLRFRKMVSPGAA